MYFLDQIQAINLTIVLILSIRVVYFSTMKANTATDIRLSNIYRFGLHIFWKACIHKCEIDSALKVNQANLHSRITQIIIVSIQMIKQIIGRQLHEETPK